MSAGTVQFGHFFSMYYLVVLVCFLKVCIADFCIALPLLHIALCSDVLNPDSFKLAKLCFLCSFV